MNTQRTLALLSNQYEKEREREDKRRQEEREERKELMKMLAAGNSSTPVAGTGTPFTPNRRISSDVRTPVSAGRTPVALARELSAMLEQREIMVSRKWLHFV